MNKKQQKFDKGEARWTKVSELSVGTKIAVPDSLDEGAGVSWDEIVEINRVGREKVYDIEVEGTRNFVGNNIFAHNTYIADKTASLSFEFEGFEFKLASLSDKFTISDLRFRELGEGIASVSAQIMDHESRITDYEFKLASLSEQITDYRLRVTDSNNGLIFDKQILANGGLVVDQIGSLGDKISLLNDVEFFGRPYFNNDTGGFIVMSEGSEYASVSFESEYLNQPVVNVTITLENQTASGSLNEPASPEFKSLKSLNPTTIQTAELIFENDIRYIVMDKDTRGFAVKLNKPAPFDMQLSWTALAIKDARTVFSPKPSPSLEKKSLNVSEFNSLSPTPEPILTPTPESTPETTPTSTPSVTPTPTPDIDASTSDVFEDSTSDVSVTPTPTPDIDASTSDVFEDSTSDVSETPTPIPLEVSPTSEGAGSEGTSGEDTSNGTSPTSEPEL